jgi:hypothetical protein
MALWKEPELPPLERLPTKRAISRPGWGKRAWALLSGVALTTASLVGLKHSLEAGSTGFGSFGALALLLPAIVLVRYALTGKIKAP